MKYMADTPAQPSPPPVPAPAPVTAPAPAPAAGKPPIPSEIPKLTPAKPKRQWGFWKKKQREAAKPPATQAAAVPAAPAGTLAANLQVLARELDQTEKRDYWHLRLKKKTTVLIIGLLILGLWLVLGGRYLMQNHQVPVSLSFKGQDLVAQTAAPTTEPTQRPAVLIRVRYIKPDLATAAAELAAYLGEKGYPGAETALDEASNYTGIMVVTKTATDPVRAGLEAVLEERYDLASAAAELTADSDFDAVVLYAPSASDSAETK